jgi:hypothetical protein
MEEKSVKYEIYEAYPGMHKVRGVKLVKDNIWWSLSQYQFVNNKWTDAGCNWFNKGDIKGILEEEGELIESGEGCFREVGDPDLEGLLHLIGIDEMGNEYFIG